MDVFGSAKSLAWCWPSADRNRCRYDCDGGRSDRNLPKPRTLVRLSSQTVVYPAELDLRSGLDDLVPADGILGLADSAPAGWLDAANGTDLVLHSAGAERRMVLDVLRCPQPASRLGQYRPAIRADRRDRCGVLSVGQIGGLLSPAAVGLGRVRHGPQLLDARCS